MPVLQCVDKPAAASASICASPTPHPTLTVMHGHEDLNVSVPDNRWEWSATKTSKACRGIVSPASGDMNLAVAPATVVVSTPGWYHKARSPI